MNTINAIGSHTFINIIKQYQLYKKHNKYRYKYLMVITGGVHWVLINNLEGFILSFRLYVVSPLGCMLYLL